MNERRSELQGRARELRVASQQWRMLLRKDDAPVLGMTPAEDRIVVTADSMRQRRLLEAQVERWIAEAKKLGETGKDADALELYRRAADELSGAPWLQQRTAELARKLKMNAVAIEYFRRAATAFQIAAFAKRAVAPLRTAWSLALEGLPATSKPLVYVAVELVQLYRRLGFTADAALTFERTNSALRARGFSEIPAHVLDATRSHTPPNGLAAPRGE
jgi:tetratricopeptide (TPR) repeat protein